MARRPNEELEAYDSFFGMSKCSLEALSGLLGFCCAHRVPSTLLEKGTRVCLMVLLNQKPTHRTTSVFGVCAGELVFIHNADAAIITAWCFCKFLSKR
jgi:hypothetical protein